MKRKMTKETRERMSAARKAYWEKKKELNQVPLQSLFMLVAKFPLSIARILLS